MRIMVARVRGATQLYPQYDPVVIQISVIFMQVSCTSLLILPDIRLPEPAGTSC